MPKRVVGMNDLETYCKKNNKEDLLNEWDNEKNGTLNPSDISYSSSKKVWWRCSKGHEWQAKVSNRVYRNDGCPFCSGRYAIKGENDLQTLYPDIAKEWHPTKNGDLKPSDVTAKSGISVWWHCKEGHEWKATVAQRTDKNTGCPFCSGRYAIKGETDLQTLYPDIAKEWHPTKNGDLKPSDITAHSGVKFWWLGKCGHEWQATVADRTNGDTGCPYCANKKVLPGFNDLQTKYPEISKEWNYEKNGNTKPTDVAYGSNKKVWWKCDKGHEWQTRIVSRTSIGIGCPICSNKIVVRGYNDLATTHPALAREWNYEKNGGIKPTDVTYGSTKKVWWKCEKGHEWQAVIFTRSQGRGCPICTGKGSSLPEQGIAFYLEQVCRIEQRIRVCKQEIDIYLPEYKIGIEYDGRYYHNQSSIVKETQKDQILSENGIRIIRVKESNDNSLVGNLIFYKFDNMRSNYEWAMKQLACLLSGITGEEKFNSIKIAVNDDLLKIRERFDLYNKEKSVQALSPEIAKEWNYEKNGLLKPDMFPYGSHTKVWWKCDKGHEWQASIKSRTLLKAGCPYCAGQRAIKGDNDLQTILPNIAAEWHPTKNGELKPADVTPNSNKKVWWRCANGHEWQAKVFDRTRNNTGCPYCSGVGSKIVQNIDTGEIYNSLKEAARSCGLKSGATISDCCKGKLKTAGGYHWEYYVEN